MKYAPEVSDFKIYTLDTPSIHTVTKNRIKKVLATGFCPYYYNSKISTICQTFTAILPIQLGTSIHGASEVLYKHYSSEWTRIKAIASTMGIKVTEHISPSYFWVQFSPINRQENYSSTYPHVKILHEMIYDAVKTPEYFNYKLNKTQRKFKEVLVFHIDNNLPISYDENGTIRFNPYYKRPD